MKVTIVFEDDNPGHNQTWHLSRVTEFSAERLTEIVDDYWGTAAKVTGHQVVITGEHRGDPGEAPFSFVQLAGLWTHEQMKHVAALGLPPGGDETLRRNASRGGRP